MSELIINPKLLPLLQKKKRFKVIVGGRGSGKSIGIADIMIMKIETEAADVLCLREFQNSIDDSVHKLFEDRIYSLNVEERFNILSTTVESKESGGKTTYKGAARNPHSLKSAHGFKYSWFEESQTISQKTLELLLPTLRSDDSEYWFTANPQSSKDPFSERFINPFKAELDKHGYYEDDLHLIIVLNYTDNPFFPKELETQRQYDYENLPRSKYDHIWLGEFDDGVDNAIIPTEWFDAAIDAHTKLGITTNGIEVVAHDPSDLGSDAKGLAYRHGILLVDVQEKEDGTVNDGGDWAANYAASNKVDAFIFDGDGMGIALLRQLKEALEPKRISVEVYRGSNEPRNPNGIFESSDIVSGGNKTNKDTFFNRRAQAYWLLRERFRKTYLAVVKKEYQNPDDLISINPLLKNINAIRAEVCRIPTIENNAGKIQIMPKDKMKKLGIESPNMADSIAMAMFYQPEVKRKVIANPMPTMNRW